MKIKTRYDDGGIVVIVSYDNINFEPQAYCGHSHCEGECGLPALMLLHNGKEYKTHSSMVACGPVFQSKPQFTGKKVYIPESAGESSELIKKMWW